MDQAIKENCQAIYQQLLQEMETQTVSLEEVAGPSDEIDAGVAEKVRSLDLRLHSRRHIYLNKLRLALQRLEAGQHGRCEECDNEISEARLLARPTATMCIKCKEEEERADLGVVHRNRHSVKWQTGLLYSA